MVADERVDEGEMGRDILFLFAHQDDEVGALASIMREVRAGHRVWCVYLTDGAAACAAAIRDAETRRLLSSHRIDAGRIVFLGELEGRIKDGALWNELVRAQRLLRRWIASMELHPTRIYTIDWEGGHADHDAVHLIALAIALDDRCPLHVFSLYNGYRRPAKLFRVIDFVPAKEQIETFPVRWADALRIARAPLAFHSQRRTWLALGLGFVYRTLARRAERLRLANVERIAVLPHAGRPLYETLFGVSAVRFMDASKEFRLELLERAGLHGGAQAPELSSSSKSDPSMQRIELVKEPSIDRSDG